MLQAAYDATGIARFFGCGSAVFRFFTHKPYSMPRSPLGVAVSETPSWAIRSRRPPVTGHAPRVLAERLPSRSTDRLK